jgi:hypothetical protein
VCVERRHASSAKSAPVRQFPSADVRGRRRHLEPIDEAGVVADYEAGATLATIQQSHDIGLVRLYRILDHHQVPRRRPTAPRLGNRVKQRVLADYRAGTPIDDIARKHHISPASVGNIALKAGLTRGRRYTGDELVDMIVRWFVGESERDAITKVGMHLAQPGLRSLVDVDPTIAERMRRRLVDALGELSSPPSRHRTGRPKPRRGETS